MSRQWLIGGICAIGAAGIVAWIVSNSYWEEVEVLLPLRGEAARNPFYTAERVTEALGATAEWRRTLMDMPEPDAVLVLAYWHWDLIDERRERIERWVEAGGRLVLLDELIGGDYVLHEWSGLAQSYQLGEETAGESGEGDATEAFEPPEESAEGEETEAVEPPADDAPRIPGVPYCGTLELVHGRSQTDPDRRQYAACEVPSGRILTSARTPEWAVAPASESGFMAVRVPIGRGSITWVDGEPFGNRTLLEKEHGILFADALELHRGDHVVFVSEEEAASLLELVWTYGAPVVLLAVLVLGLALWRNAARFGPMAAALDVSRRSLAEQIRGTARFALRVGSGRGLHAAMLRAVHEAARRHFPGYERLPEQERVAALAGHAGVDAGKLRDAMYFIGSGGAHEFKNSVALLDAVRRKL